MPQFPSCNMKTIAARTTPKSSENKDMYLRLPDKTHQDWLSYKGLKKISIISEISFQ